jgi:hypothetical protein
VEELKGSEEGHVGHRAAGLRGETDEASHLCRKQERLG